MVLSSKRHNGCFHLVTQVDINVILSLLHSVNIKKVKFVSTCVTKWKVPSITSFFNGKQGYDDSLCYTMSSVSHTERQLQCNTMIISSLFNISEQ